MTSTREQRRRYREKYPEKIKEQRIKYLDNKIKKRVMDQPEYMEELKTKLIRDFQKLTRLLFSDILPPYCEQCGAKESLEIHHLAYKYPIQRQDLMRLCRKCHIEAHQKEPLFPMER